MRERVKCNNADCSNCANAVKVKNLFGNEKFVCQYYQARHNAIKARECGKYKCTTPNKYPCFCRDCRAK